VLVLYCFFFQAEDGIRDFHVTGVQTCALPILSFFILQIYAKNISILKLLIEMEYEFYIDDLKVDAVTSGNDYMVFINGEYIGKRSEERRVGKECRSRL